VAIIKFQAAQPWLTLLARLILGVTLFIAGISKVVNFDGSILAVRLYQILPFELSAFAGIALPILEIAVGLLLITGTFTRFAALAGALFMLAFIIAIASVWARGISIDCGCFGNGGEVDPSQTQYPLDILRDLGLLVCGAWAFWKPKSVLAVDRLLADDLTVIDEEDEDG
jgi:uncharacterized membrane protein YphA (DoxX/SURF4 family)